MENLLKTIGEKFKVLRKNKNLTQADVANLLDLSHSAYAKIERGATDMTINRLEEIAKIFEMTGLEVMRLGENTNSTQNNNQNNAYSMINNNNNNTITIPINPEDIKDIVKKMEVMNIAFEKLTKRIEILENDKK